MRQPDNAYLLLALCARAWGHLAQYRQLRQRALAEPAWRDVLALAESHGLGPLLYFHLRAAGVSLPANIKQELQGRYLQHSHANQVRARMLAEILDAFEAAGIQALVLKGAALAHLVYPSPGLRVMRDLDILVSRADSDQAQSLLTQLGFQIPPAAARLPANHRHLPVVQRRVEGMPVSVEIHHNLYAKGMSAAELEALHPAALSFEIEGVTVHTLGYEDMLRHIYRHMLEGAVFRTIRLIWVADLVSIAERFALDIDWPQVDPNVLNALAMFHWLAPLSEKLLSTAPIQPDRPPWGIGLEFEGWPKSSLAAQRYKGYWGILLDSFFPAEWWLRLYYGLENGPALWWGRWIRHPLHIMGWVAHYYLNRVNMSSDP